MSESYYRESVVNKQLGTQETTIASSVDGWVNGNIEDASSKNYDLNALHSNVARVRTGLFNKIIGDTAQVQKGVADFVIDDMDNTNILDDDKIGFITDSPSGTGEDTPVASVYTPTGNITLSKQNLWFGFESSKVVIDLNGGKTFTLSGTGCQGKLRFVNEGANSIIITGNNCKFDIECTNGKSSVDWNPTTAYSGSYFVNGELSSLVDFPDQAEVRSWIDDKSGFKDSDVNGSLRFWQRYTIPIPLQTTPAYVADRFEAWGAGAGANFEPILDANGNYDGFKFTNTTDDVYLSKKREGKVARELDIPVGGTAPFTVAINASSTAGLIADNVIVEVFYPSVEDNYTVSELAVAAQTVSITASTTRPSVTFDLPDQSTSGYDYFNGFMVKTTYVYDTSGGTISIQKWQGEKGSYATEFEYVPHDVELARCERYYETSGSGSLRFSGDVTLGSTYYKTAPYKTEKRIAGTVSATSLGTVNFAGGGLAIAGSSIALSASNVATATGAAGFFLFSYTADAEI